MSFTAAIKTCFAKYITFRGRAPRSEFWYFHLFVFLVMLVIVVAAAVTATNAQEMAPIVGVVGAVFYLAIILPGLAVMVRRLHDRNRSGWHYWWVLVPFVGGIIVFIWMCQKGVEGENRFGPDPLAH
jgi:uncharacterized membrane protein YhaH (DUF805 family)